MYKEKKLIIVIGVIIFVLIIIFTTYTLWYLSKCTSNLLTEKDMLDAANDIAKNWSSTACLAAISVDGYVECGEYHVTWIRYVYVDNKTLQDEYPRAIAVIYEEGNFKTQIWPLGDDRPLGTWNITCTEAFGIAKNNKEVKKFLKAFPKHNVEVFKLSNASSIPIWRIEMVDWGFMDDPHWAKIRIDATTGEVLYVEADLSDGSSYLICLVPLVIIISILLVILLSKSKRFTTFAATGFALFLLPALFLHIYHYSAIFTFMALVFGAVLWKGLEKYMGRDFLKSGDKEVVYGLFGLLAANYFGLIIALSYLFLTPIPTSFGPLLSLST